MSDFRIVFDEDGYPRELRTAADRARAIAQGALARETDVVVYREGEPAYACKAGDLRALWGEEPERGTEAPGEGDAPPREGPALQGRTVSGWSEAPPPGPLLAPPPERIGGASKSFLAASLDSLRAAIQAMPTTAPKPLPPRAPPRPRPRPAPAARPKSSCLANLFWLFLIFLLLLAFV